MAEQCLGVGFEIHGGGTDLLFPHHENEASQTRAARGHELTKLWMHNGMIQLSGEKMAKSVGNIAPLHEVLEANGRHALLMYLSSGHYRQPLAFSQEELDAAARSVQRVRETLRGLLPGAPSPPEMSRHVDAFFDALANDFNAPAARAAMFDWIHEANRRGGGIGDSQLREMLSVLGLGDLEALRGAADLAASDPEALELLAQREEARRARDFETADRVREQLRARGWELRDGPEGPELIAVSQR
jgi:cysteinyl-tRNA synthetase